MPKLVNLSMLSFSSELALNLFKLSIFQTFLDQILNTKKVLHNLTKLLSKIGIFGAIGSEL
jgi:hypothetical protein